LRRRILAVVASMTVLALAACSSSTTPAADETAPAEKLKVAFVYIGPVGDHGWTYKHDEGRKAMVEALGDQVETTFIENIPEGPGSKKTFQDLARQGYKLIFGATFGYMDSMLEVAAEYPDVKFMHATGYKTAPNMGTYFGAAEEARYLSGMAAASVSKTGKIGYVAAFPIPEVIRGINAFTLGAQAVNPKATVKVIWTSTWFDPNIEKQAALSLLNSGSDVIAQHQDTPAAGEAAESKGARWVGYHDNMERFAPKAWVTGAGWDWGPFYISQVKAVLNGTWTNDQYYGNMKDGMVKLFPLASDVPADVQARIKTAQDAIIAGTLRPFDGPVLDQSGKERVAQGASPDLGTLLGMDYFVKGVIGTIKN
jgi:basic membrane protein A and related proteins